MPGHVVPLTATAPLILVVGMHRSGTSLLGSVLEALGVGLAGQLIAGDRSNPQGYYEWRQVVEIQEQLLIDLDRWWPSHRGSLPLPQGWLRHPATAVARRQLLDLLQPQLQRQVGPWAIKDPRTSRLLPLWLELAQELAIPLQWLLAVRDPAEVVWSLLQRDAQVTGMDAARAQQLWWRHNLEPLLAAPIAAAPLVIDYGRWFSQPESQLDQLIRSLPLGAVSPDQRADALARIRPDHRRSQAGAAAVQLHPPVRRLYQQLLHSRRQHWPAAEPPRSLARQTLTPPAPLQLAQDPALWPEWLDRWRHHPAPRHAGSVRLAPSGSLYLCGLPAQAWQCHLWLDRLPLQALASQGLAVDPSNPHRLVAPAESGAPAGDKPDAEAVQSIALNLECPALERSEHWLTHLRQHQAIWDPDPARVWLLRALGLPAWWLDPAAPANGWLQQSAALDPALWARHLGLPAPEADGLLVLGPAGPAWDRALAEEMRLGRNDAHPAIAYLPGWPELIISTMEAALACAGWLAVAASSSQRLIWLAPGDHDLDAWLATSSPSGLSPLRPENLLTPAALREQLNGARPEALAEDRPSPPCQEVFRWEQSEAPQAAVLVSLHNYAERITDALDSVASQRQRQLELIVVDDASGDDGLAMAQAWMAARVADGAHPFVRLLLLRHARNTGLAAARNTAFTAARAPWCFVLDADNVLFPDAVAECLNLALTGADDLAVVHPLLAVQVESGRLDEQRTLVRPQSWQRERFRFENHVDAMALVRRSAWLAVGGYTHIEGGWEDYDFWCKLLNAGFHGLQCPRLLAAYCSHPGSMSHLTTNHSWPALARTLQRRHPWLALPLAQ